MEGEDEQDIKRGYSFNYRNSLDGLLKFTGSHLR